MSGSSQAARALAPERRRAGQSEISDRDFELFRKLIYREAGIHLPPSKKQLLTRRLGRRLEALELSSFADYYRRVSSAGAGAERVAMLNCVATNETRFFREARQFELLASEIIPRWRAAAEGGRRPKRVRAWSAACSTGQEAYTLAMVLLHELPPSAGWRVEVLASDISTEVLEVARAAVWPIEQVGDIPERFLKRFMLRGKGTNAGSIKAAPEVRAVVDCRRLNLHRDCSPEIGIFDLILCRNVLIYFDRESRAGALTRLLDHLAPDGYIFGGHAESLSSITGELVAVAPTVYRRADPAGASR